MTQELIFKETNIAAYDEFRSQLTALQAGNEKAVFDYRDPKGNKEARSHVYKLRQTKAAIEKVRKQEKEIYLLKGRQVDSEAKEISAVVEQMIEVHEIPLKEIEREEELRIEKHKANIAWFSDMLNCWSDSTSLQEAIDRVNQFKIDESFEEFEAEAHRAKQSALDNLNERLQERIKYEAEQAELARLRQEAAEREQKEREERIAREAAEAARIAAEQAAEAERRRIQDEADRQAREAQLAVERAQREKAETEAAALRQQQEAEAAAKAAHERAEREKQAAIEAERKRVAEEQAALAAEAARREKDKENKKRVNNEILADLAAAGLDEANAKLVITAMAKGLVRNVKINY